MTIDEAIAHAREKAKEKRKEMQCKTCKLFARSDLHPLQGYCRKNEFRSIEIDSWSKVCSEYVPKEMCKYAEEHEQIAEWLEELKEFREISKKNPFLVNMIKHDRIVRSKAIDDLSNTLKENYDYLPQILSQEAFDGYIDEYAEQLKGGAENEQSI